MKQHFFTFAITLLTIIFSTTASAADIAYPADGVYSIQPQCAPGKELSVQNHASNWGANVIIDNLNPNWHKWKVQRLAGTDFYSIVAVHSNLALDVGNGQATNVATWPFLGERAHLFRILDAGGGYYIIQCAVASNQTFVLDVAYGENRAGVNVLSWGFNNGSGQKWKLVPVQRLSTFQAFTKQATQTVNAYVMPDLRSRNGNERVDKGDNVAVFREEGNAYLVQYPVSGGTKTRWVNKNEIFSGSKPTPTSNPTPSNTMTDPMKNMYCTWRSHSNWGWSDYTYNSFHPDRCWHLGLDVYGDNGYVYAMSNGTVVSCSNSNRGGGANGRYIVIKHNINGQTFYSFYAHLASIKVSDGQNVSAGEHIGIAGGSGSGSDNLYKTHLHFAIVDILKPGSYYGYATKFSGDKIKFGDVTFFNPRYVLQHGRLP